MVVLLGVEMCEFFRALRSERLQIGCETIVGLRDDVPAKPIFTASSRPAMDVARTCAVSLVLPARSSNRMVVTSCGGGRPSNPPCAAARHVAVDDALGLDDFEVDAVVTAYSLPSGKRITCRHSPPGRTSISQIVLVHAVRSAEMREVEGIRERLEHQRPRRIELALDDDDRVVGRRG